MSSPTDLVVRTALITVTVLVVVGLARLITQIGDIFIVVLVSSILATGIAPLVTRLEQVRWSRRGFHIVRPYSVLIVFLVIIVLVLSLTGVIVTPVVLEGQQFFAHLPENLAHLQTLAQQWQARYTWLPDIAGIISRLPGEISRLSRYFGAAAGVAFRFLGGIALTITVLVLAFYLLLEGPHVKTGFLALFPRHERRQAADVLEQIGAKFGGWVRGQLLLGLIIGVAAAVGMAAIRMPFALLLGIVAAVTELIPMIGPILGAIPAVFLALFQPTWKLIFTIVWYTLIQEAEAHVVVPRVMRASVGLSPVLTIIALLIGARLLGIAGALLAVPVAAASQVVVMVLLDRIRPKD